MPKVSVYIRNHQTREYEPADPKTAYPQGTIFCLRYKKDGKRKWETLNDTFVTGHRMSYCLARSIAKMREGELELRKPTAPKPEAAKPCSEPIAEAVEVYLAGLRLAKRPHKSIVGKQHDLGVFMAVCPHVVNVNQFRREHILQFKHHLEGQAYAPKSVENMMMSVVTFFNERKIELELKKEDWPVYRDNDPEPYSDEEMLALIKHAGEHSLLIRSFVGTGMREQELSHLMRADIDERRKMVKVQPQFCDHCPNCKSRGNKWFPKTEEGIRDIPIGQGLLKELLARPAGLLFPSSTGKVEGHFLRDVQEVAKKAGVPYAKLHRFRDSFITNKLRDGVDIRTVQRWAGHKDVNVTMGYAAWLDEQSDAARRHADREDTRYVAAVAAD